MKSASVDFISHLTQEETSLATCVKITKRDGSLVGFTDNDVDLIVDGVSYLSQTGYNRSAISSQTGFSIDNLEITGWFEEGSIQEQDIRNGVYDRAEVVVYAVNHQSVADSSIILKSGNLGQIEISPSGSYKLEIRGKKQILSQNIGDLYQAECRADVGDSKCKFPILPNVIERESAYSVGSFLRVPVVELGVSDEGISSANLPVSMGSFGVNGQNYDWGNWIVTAAVRKSSYIFGNLTAYSQYFFTLGSSDVYTSYTIYQIVELSGAANYDSAVIDSGKSLVSVSAFSSTVSNSYSHTGKCIVEALDSFNVSLETIYDSGAQSQVNEVWKQLGFSTIPIPSGTRKIKITLVAERSSVASGLYVYTAFDGVSAELFNLGLASVDSPQSAYDDLIYEVVTGGTTAVSQPTYDLTIDSETTDGTAVLKAYRSFCLSFFILEVIDEFQIKIVVNAEDLPAGWFIYGALFLETGLKAGSVMEIKNWTIDGVITVYLPFNTTQVVYGDRGYLYPGCDKRLSSCTGKFSLFGSNDFSSGNFLNFRGEPFLPGRDFLGQYPDA
jgi:hypothetical protein